MGTESQNWRAPPKQPFRGRSSSFFSLLPNQHLFPSTTLPVMADTQKQDKTSMDLDIKRENAHLDDDQSSIAIDSERAERERKLVRKLDLRFSIMVVIYILNYIDR
jgi:hypothetical protein